MYYNINRTFVGHPYLLHLYLVDPLQSLINPKIVGKTVQGWLNAYSEGGWLPKWASPGYRGSMLGTAGDIVISDAIVKNIPGFDRQLALEAILKDAYTAPPPDQPGVGRVCLPTYLEYGYIPRGAPQVSGSECTEVVSRAQSYYQSDFAISSAAQAMGSLEISRDLAMRAMNYSKIYDPVTGFMRAREMSTGDWPETFDQYAWGGDYMESGNSPYTHCYFTLYCNIYIYIYINNSKILLSFCCLPRRFECIIGPWQYRFTVPHDPMGLSSLFAESDKSLCDSLETSQTTSPIFHIGTFEGLIKEQTEMVQNCWGQYAHNDQTVHHVLYMFSAIDPAGYTGYCSSRGQYWLREALLNFYKPGPDMFTGDEDNGEMGAWFVLSSLGLYSLSPGTADYVLGAPLFSKVNVRIGPEERTLTIIADNNTRENAYVHEIYWNEKLLGAVEGKALSYPELSEGGVLRFVMGSSPVLSSSG
jgi:putative alpha-1,2-mannosidase